MRVKKTPLRPLSPVLVSLGFTLLLAACSESGTDPASDNILVDPDAQFRGLQIIGDKDVFAESIRTALLSQYSGGGGGGGVISPLELEGAPVSADTDQSVSESSTTDFTGTNVQETGVDEADRVKTDGEFLYVLSTVAGQVGPVEIAADSAPQGQGKSQIRILALDADAADASLVSTLDIEESNGFTDGLYLHTGDNFKSLLLTSSTFVGYWDQWHNPAGFHGQQSTIRKFDVADPSAVSIAETLTLEGQIVSSRRVGSYLYVATRYYPSVPGVNPWETDPETAATLINQADIDTLLPQYRRESQQDSQPLADADRCFVAQKPERGYYSPDIITLAVVDIGSMQVTDSVCYLGATETLYASTNSAYLATTEYAFAEDDVLVDPDGPDTTSLPAQDSRITTDIHQFDFNGASLRYVGTGAIEGHLGWNLSQKSFRLSEKDGYLRVASYSGEQSLDKSPVLVSVLKPVGDRVLELIARLPNETNPDHIGKPGEQLHASRFLGDKAYLVTFRQTDPLYVIDLKNPNQPVVSGELVIEGYSDYLHPIGENHLLGIGKGAIAAPGQPDAFRGAFAQGVKLSLFDVSDPSSPREVQSLEIGKRGTESEALRDHHGITVQRATAERPTRVAIGIDVHDRETPYSSGPSGWYNWSETGLFGFEVETGANAGITQHGKMIVESWSDQQPWGPTRYGDRSVIVNDSVYYIHGEQVFGANWNAMQNISGPR
ncbi:MAG: beta-propeller domain-containing protein [Gammaproteobacteria bacterium]|nr:beta-propeller domain-containing protein [Gammaproteobacteria bacterium]